MFSSLSGMFFSLVTAAIIVGADYHIKLAADGHGRLISAPMIIGGGLYLLSAVMWFYTMRHISLGQAAVAYSMFSLVGLFIVGVVFFGETAEWRDLAGIVLAVGAMGLMLRWL